MYSSLLSNGLAQLWDSPSPAVVQLEPEHPTTCSTSKQQQQQQRQRSRKQQQYRSFLSFDVSPDSFRASVASTSSGITIPNKRRLVLSNVDLDGEPEEEYHVQLFSSSSSRRSFESAVTVPQPTSKRNHHHRSRISSSYFSIASSTSNTASSSTQQPSAASSSSSNTTQPQPLTRRRSLPSAKPVPLCKPPSIPHPHSTIDSRSSIRRRSGSKQIRSSFASSWLPRIPVSTFSPSLPHFGLNFSSSETEGGDGDGDGDGDAKERLDEGYESSSSSSSDSQRTRSSLSSMGKLSRRSISSASTVTLYNPVPMARFTQVTTTSGEVSVFDDDDDDDDDDEDGMSRFSGKASSVGLPPSPSPTKSLPSSVTISRSSTVSTNYRRAKRSDALAVLEGRGRLKLPSFGMHHLRSHSNPLSTKTKGQQAKEKENIGMGSGARKTVPFAPSSFVSFSEEDDDDDEEDEEDERWPSSVGVSKAWRKSDRKSDSRPRRRENFIDLK